MDETPPQTPLTARSERVVYEPPMIRRLGTLAEVTKAIVTTSTDGFGPGSAL